MVPVRPPLSCSTLLLVDGEAGCCGQSGGVGLYRADARGGEGDVSGGGLYRADAGGGEGDVSGRRAREQRPLVDGLR